MWSSIFIVLVTCVVVKVSVVLHGRISLIEKFAVYLAFVFV